LERSDRNLKDATNRDGAVVLRKESFLNPLDNPLRRHGIGESRRAASPFVRKQCLQRQVAQRDQRNRGAVAKNIRYMICFGYLRVRS
jgi:hypothetical protein